jgi:hypothetical protein
MTKKKTIERKTTRRVRVKLDYVLEYDEDLDSIPAGFALVNLNDLVLGGLRATTLIDKPKARLRFNRAKIVALLPGTLFSAQLDHRKRTARAR